MATLYGDASAATANPAVTLRRVGSAGGDAAAFAYDLARSVVQTRVGTPHAFAPTAELRPIASDLGADMTDLKVDWLALGPYPDTGAFVSRVHEASDPRAVWGALTAASTGGGVTFETRSGRTATPGTGWSDWRATGAGGAIQSPPGRYIQYRATLAPGATGGSPNLTSVDLTYEPDTTAPAAAIGGVQVSGRTATVTFSSTAADVQRFECSLAAALSRPARARRRSRAWPPAPTV